MREGPRAGGCRGILGQQAQGLVDRPRGLLPQARLPQVPAHPLLE
jgi:hypothetical protein